MPASSAATSASSASSGRSSMITPRAAERGPAASPAPARIDTVERRPGGAPACARSPRGVRALPPPARGLTSTPAAPRPRSRHHPLGAPGLERRLPSAPAPGRSAAGSSPALGGTAAGARRDSRATRGPPQAEAGPAQQQVLQVDDRAEAQVRADLGGASGPCRPPAGAARDGERASAGAHQAAARSRRARPRAIGGSTPWAALSRSRQVERGQAGERRARGVAGARRPVRAPPAGARAAASTTSSAISRQVVSLPPATDSRPRSSQIASSRLASDGSSTSVDRIGRSPAKAPTTSASMIRRVGKWAATARSR